MKERIDIQKMMWSHGWLSLFGDDIPVDKRLRQYTKSIIAHDYDTTCIVNVCENEYGMELSGEFGILWIECLYSENAPYTYDNLQDMLAALTMAEDDLLMIGIPFAAKYGFHGKNAANKKRRTDALRRKYKCDEIEKELDRKRMIKRQQEQERRKNAHENNAE